MKFIFYSFLLLNFFIYSFDVPIVSAQSSEKSKSKKEQIDNFFGEIFSENTAGAAIAVVKDGEVVFANGYGMANLDYDVPNTANTIFHAASLSKQFTTYSILLLEQEGKLSLDDDIRKYIPEVPDFGYKITLHHLASHTSGLRDQWRLLHMAGWRADDVIRNKDILDLVAKQTDLNFEPGSKLMYSNTGFTLLAEVVARVSGKTFAEFTMERIFQPLGMTNSQFYDDYEKVVKNRAYSYKKEGEVTKKSKLSFSTVGATSLFTTVVDLCKWAIHLNELGNENQSLSQRMNTQALLNNGDTTEAAMGQWTGVKFKGMEWFDHSGSDAGFRAYFSRFPESNSAVVYLGNVVPPEAGASDYALAVADGYLSEYYMEESQKKEKKLTKASDFKAVKLSKAQLSKFVGKYWESEEQYNREIKLKNGKLIYYRSSSSETVLLPVGENEFKMIDDPNDVSVFFEKDKDNNASMRLNINDERTVNFLKYEEGFPLPVYVGSYYCPEVNNTLQVFQTDDGLSARIYKQEEVALLPVQEDFFKGTGRTLSKVEFLRDTAGKVTGLLVSNGGATGVRYRKESQKS